MYSFHSHSLKSRSLELLTGTLRFLVRIVVQPIRYCWQHKATSVIVLVLVMGFYWYEIRPIVISRNCSLQASMDARQLLRSKADITKDKATRDSYKTLITKNMYLRSDYESFLQKCLLHYGFRIVPAGNQVAAQKSSPIANGAKAANNGTGANAE